MDDVVSLPIFLLLHIHFSNNPNMGHIKVIFQYYNNVMFLLKTFIGNPIATNTFCIYFFFFLIWFQFLARPICLTIFRGDNYSFWALWYVFKHMKYNCLVWWGFYFFLQLLSSYWNLQNSLKRESNLEDCNRMK